jgi:hypothetical protein
VTLLAKYAVVAEPAILISLCNIFGARKTIWMETLAAEVTAKELLS